MTFEPETREQLEARFGEVLTTDEATAKYRFESFLAPFAFVTRKEDNVRGIIRFQHMPRFYFDFSERK